MIANKKEFSLGAGLMAGFIVVLVLMFLPLFNGKNTLNYLDDLFNSISKGSAYYIPKLKNDIQVISGKNVDLELTLPSGEIARDSQTLFARNGIPATIEGSNLRVQGGMGQILGAAIEDADILFHNRGEQLESKYGIDGRPALYTWWNTLKAMQKSLNEQELFEEGKVVYSVMTRGVETAYNYYKIVPQSMSEKLGMVLFALVFYVIYTMWYGYAILYMFEGWGLQISH